MAYADARTIADDLCERYERYMTRFGSASRRAAGLFAARDWSGLQGNGIARLSYYPEAVSWAVASLQHTGGASSKAAWAEAKRLFGDRFSDHSDAALAQSFFNSVSRRVFGVVGQAPDIEFTDSPSLGAESCCAPKVCRSYEHDGNTEALVGTILAEHPLIAPFADAANDSRLAAQRIEAHLRQEFSAARIDRIDMLTSVFYRNKGAYLIGRIQSGRLVVPLVFAFMHPVEGVRLDAVLLTHDAVHILFSFTRSYLQADIADHRETVRFLTSIMPSKPLAEIYMALGYDKHGKSELFRDLARHLEQTTERFISAPGKAGMVMLVFTLPSYDVVFKVIKDRFDPPKRTDRQHVMNRYRLVFKHDRVGRLIDAQEFEQLELHKSRFDVDLLAKLLSDASATVSLRGETVVFEHLYTERRVTPLDVYCRTTTRNKAIDAIIDYGAAIKDLAAANIFPGDIFPKNFGVTRHGRVIFYDYDELCLLEECRFRRIPPPRTHEEEMSDEPWYAVAENDVFPEELPSFLGIHGPLREAFMAHHADLFGVSFWHRMQDIHARGELPDVFPYRSRERLPDPSKKRH